MLFCYENAILSLKQKKETERSKHAIEKKKMFHLLNTKTNAKILVLKICAVVQVWL